MKSRRWHLTVWALLFLAGNCLAQSLRVTTWDMARPIAPTGAPENRIQEAAAALKELNPDVILLQHARDWQMCRQLAQALKPADYSVVVCSSFRDARTGAAGQQQAAILSKQKAYFSWSEAWRAEGGAPCPGGFAFAAIQANKQRIGFFSVQLELPPTAVAGGGTNSVAEMALPTRQWLQAVAGFKSWMTNRLGAAVMAGAFTPDRTGRQLQSRSSLTALVDPEVTTAFLGAPLSHPLTFSFTGQTSRTSEDFNVVSLAPNPETLPGVVLNHSPATCELTGNAQELTVRNLVPAGEWRSLLAQAQAKPAALAKPAPLARAQAREVRPAAEAQPGVQAAEYRALAPAPDSSAPVIHLRLPAWAVAAGGAAVMAVMVGGSLALRKRRRSRSSPALLAAASVEGSANVPSSITVVVAPPRGTTSSATECPAVSRPSPVIHIEAPGTQTQSETWPQRPWPAEQRAQAAAALNHPGLLLHLSQWLKQRFVQKLVSDRADLLQTQHAATLKLTTVDERLTRLEEQIQQQNQAHEQRIAELTRELLAAKEENRELIRARIVQVKAEMAAARARVMAEGRGEKAEG